MRFNSALFIGLLCTGLGIPLPCHAQQVAGIDLPPTANPAAEANDRPQLPGQDAATTTDSAFAEARRLWQIVLEKRQAGKREEARAAYVPYLEAAYAVNQNPWLLLELGRAHELLGQRELALKAYKRYQAADLSKESTANRAEAEKARDRLEYAPGTALLLAKEGVEDSQARRPLSRRQAENLRRKGKGFIIGGTAGLILSYALPAVIGSVMEEKRLALPFVGPFWVGGATLMQIGNNQCPQGSGTSCEIGQIANGGVTLVTGLAELLVGAVQIVGASFIIAGGVTLSKNPRTSRRLSLLPTAHLGGSGFVFTAHF